MYLIWVVTCSLLSLSLFEPTTGRRGNEKEDENRRIDWGTIFGQGNKENREKVKECPTPKFDYFLRPQCPQIYPRRTVQDNPLENAAQLRRSTSKSRYISNEAKNIINAYIDVIETLIKNPMVAEIHGHPATEPSYTKAPEHHGHSATEPWYTEAPSKKKNYATTSAPEKATTHHQPKYSPTAGASTSS